MVVPLDNEDKRGQNVCGVKRSCGRRGCKLGHCVRRQCRQGRFKMGRAVPETKTRTTAKYRMHVLYARCFVAYRRCFVFHVAHAVDQPVYLNFFQIVDSMYYIDIDIDAMLFFIDIDNI